MNVLIIDKKNQFTEDIQSLLKNYNPIIKTSHSDNILSAYEYIQKHSSPDLILLNINENCPENSYDLIKRLYKLHLYVPIIVISEIDSIEAARLAIENKVSGFISQKHSHQVILDSIIYVLEENMFDHILPTVSMSESDTDTDTDTKNSVSLRKQVLKLFRDGRKNNQIADELNICSNTVNGYLHELLRSIETNSRTKVQ